MTLTVVLAKIAVLVTVASVVDSRAARQRITLTHWVPCPCRSYDDIACGLSPLPWDTPNGLDGACCCNRITESDDTLAYFDPPILRIITWNVADNSGMGGSFEDEALDTILGKDSGRKMADAFAVGLQEQCWQCDKAKMLEIPNAFLARLNALGSGVYETVGIKGTRESDECEKLCKSGSHGTTALFVIAKRGLVTDHKAFHRTDGCSDKIPPNEEKGVAYMRLALITGQSVCVATSHLESRNPKFRRDCLEAFFFDANKNLNWSAGCDFQFVTGDLNSRTAATAPPGQKPHLSAGSNMSALKSTDEMTGSNPFGRNDSWSGNMLAFINTVQENVYKESPVTFLPTYKLTNATKCAGKIPCYRANRPQSWTDRILHTGGTSLKYDSIHLEVSDHHPVFEEFELNFNPDYYGKN